MRILIVEDEPKAAAGVRKGLTEHDHVVDVANDGVEGVHLATSEDYDLILLDVDHPDDDDWSLLQGIRRQRQTPVFFLSGHAEVQDRVRGLDLGADDYLVKPFAFSELLARMRSVMRRGPVRADPVLLQVGDLRVDTVRRKVERAGQRIELTAKEYALLSYFMQHAGEVVSRTLIIEHVWDMNFDGDTNVVDVLVHRLRAKVDDLFAAKLIHAVRGVGYVFEARDA